MFLGKFVITISLIVTVSAISIKPKQSNEEYCYDLDNSRPQYLNMASKTPYDFVKGINTQYSVSGCQAEKIWILARHGTRLPSADSMLLLKELEELRDEIILLYETNATIPENGRLCNEDLELLKNWKWDTNMTGQYDEFLTNEGWTEMVQLGRDLRAAFPALIGNQYLSSEFLFRHTDFQRSEGSYKAFAEGLFGDQAYNSITLGPPPSTDADMLLMPYEMCDLSKENNIFQDGPDGELARFRNTEVYRKFRNDLTLKFGFTAPLSDVDINSIWEMCRFDKNWNLTASSPWCATLTESQVKIIEYYEDLNYYYKSSYGAEINTKLACSSMQDMLNNLESNDSPKLVAYFAHIAIVNLHLTAMGALKDAEAIRSDNFDRMANRKYKTSFIPFSANLAGVKYRCPNDNDAPYKVKFFLNQKELELDWCDGGLCKLQDVMERYETFHHGDCNKIYCTDGSDGADANILRSKFIYLLAVIGWFTAVKIFI